METGYMSIQERNQITISHPEQNQFKTDQRSNERTKTMKLLKITQYTQNELSHADNVML